MSRSSHFIKQLNHETKETFITFSSNIHLIQSVTYSPEVLQIRSQIINWLMFICSNLSFKNETLFHCIHLFDIYISKTKFSEVSLYEINLIAIACLSLATKQEENSCNYNKFFTDTILNIPSNQIYSVKDLSCQEMKILKTLNFKTNYANAYHFSLLFLKVCFNNCDDNESFNDILEMNDKIIKEIAINDAYILCDPIVIAYSVIKDALCNVTQCHLNQREIIKTIEEEYLMLSACNSLL